MRDYKWIFFLLTISLSLTLASAVQLHAQITDEFNDLASYNHYLSTKFGISSHPPDNFIDLNQFFVLRRVQEDPRRGQVGNMYGPIFRTKDKQCIVMYPGKPQYFTESDMEGIEFTAQINRAIKGDTSPAKPELSSKHHNKIFPRSQSTLEVKAASGLYDSNGKSFQDSVNFNFNDYVTIIAGKKAKEMFNADFEPNKK